MSALPYGVLAHSDGTVWVGTTGAGYFLQWTPQGADESSDHVYFVVDTYNWQIVLFNWSTVATEFKASFR